MYTVSEQTAERIGFLKKAFPVFAEHGLENTTIRILCRETGTVQGTLYYWFDDKTSIVCDAARYGMKVITDGIFKYISANKSDLNSLCYDFLDEVSRYKKELRFLYQVAASPVYGEKIREAKKELSHIYYKYVCRLSERINCDEQMLKSVFDLFISAAVNCVIWDEKEKSKMQLEFIYSALPEIMRAQPN